MPPTRRIARLRVADHVVFVDADPEAVRVILASNPHGVGGPCLEEASRHAPLEQLALSPQCGFSSGIGGQAMTVDEEMQKLRLVVETARDVWGEA